MLDQITPVILTYNEAPNIGRTLEQLQWARDIVVVDSFSDDETLAVAGRTSQTRVVQREFDCHESQWNFALNETGIASEWVLALDADFVLTPELVEELSKLTPGGETAGYRARFVYCVSGRPLRGSAYPPVTVLFRRDGASYLQDGHTQRVLVQGEVVDLRAPILHDDRKSFDRWLRSQARYMKLEAAKLGQSAWGDLEWADRLRKTRILAPFAVLFYCLFIKGAILDGRAGFYYAFQRLLSELILSLYLIEALLGSEKKPVIAAKSDEERAALTALKQRK
ncbi:MAG: glycosyltransferase family 2 protein [Acidobacteriota bacterium]